MRVKAPLTVVLLFTTGFAFGQLVAPDPDWKESEVPMPPVFKADQLVPIEMPRYVSLRLGVDPETLRITEDGIVRYVMVAKSPSGNMNASYEGIRCLTGEVKTYARFTTSGQWSVIGNPEWKPLNGNQPSMHALALARQGACNGRAAAANSPAEIINKLKIGAHSESNR